ncbi:hypothetical protein [Enhygromyxa salina]|nr:hypothetical protein [Enhygromyxa salina]
MLVVIWNVVLVVFVALLDLSPLAAGLIAGILSFARIGGPEGIDSIIP